MYLTSVLAEAKRALPHDVFEYEDEDFLDSAYKTNSYMNSYSYWSYTQNHSASKAESYMKLRSEGLSRKPHPCISTKVLLSFKFHKLNHPRNSNKRDFRTAS